MLGVPMAATPPPTSRTLGKTISEKRRQKQLSQKQLADRTLREDGQPISPQFLNDIERDRRRPGPFILNALAKNLELDPDELHFLAGQVPPDMVAGSTDDNRLKEVMQAFRRTYKK
jgi:transcriptional regulator with XRE-family HTH domain